MSGDMGAIGALIAISIGLVEVIKVGVKRLNGNGKTKLAVLENRLDTLAEDQKEMSNKVSETLRLVHSLREDYIIDKAKREVLDD